MKKKIKGRWKVSKPSSGLHVQVQQKFLVLPLNVACEDSYATVNHCDKWHCLKKDFYCHNNYFQIKTDRVSEHYRTHNLGVKSQLP